MAWRVGEVLGLDCAVELLLLLEMSKVRRCYPADRRLMRGLGIRRLALLGSDVEARRR